MARPTSIRALCAALCALVARDAAAQAGSPFPRDALAGDVKVAADEVQYQAETGKVILRGNAVVRRGPIVLRARSAEYDPATGEVRASGNVLLTDATRVVAADAVRAVLGGPFEAEGVLAFVKDQPVDLSGLRSVEEAARTGPNRLSFSTPSLMGDPDGRMHLRGARVTLCDCGLGKLPSWEISATEASVVPGVRATLRWPVVRIAMKVEPPSKANEVSDGGLPDPGASVAAGNQLFPEADQLVPIFVFPWLYLPLGDRQSGLLIPEITNTGASGFSLGLPVYLVLGRSADATVTPLYAFGPRALDNPSGAVRGPGARLELRWAPAERGEGRAELGWIHDLDAEPGGASGDRFGLTLLHRQQVGDVTSLQANVKLASDSRWLRDTSGDRLVEEVPYRRSDLLASFRTGPAVEEAVASYLQPFDPYSVATVTPYGTLGAARGLSSRFGAAAATLVPVAAGPLRLSGRLGAARFGPVDGEGPSMRDAVGRPAVTRGDARAELALPLLLGDAVAFAPFVRGAALGYAPEGLASSGVAWAIVGARLETELSRDFGAVRHAIVPWLEWRAATGAAGDPLLFPAFDHLDRTTGGSLTAAPGSFSQLRAAVATRFDAGARTVFRAELGQDLDLRAGRFAEGFASLALAVGRVTADAGARFFTFDAREPPSPTPVPPAIPSPALDQFTELHAGLTAEDGRGDGVRVGYLSVGQGGSGMLVAGLDPLFDERPAASVTAAASGTLGLRARLGPTRLGYDVQVPGRAAFVPSCEIGGSDRRVSALHVQQQTATFVYESQCRCFRLSLSVGLNDCGVLSYNVGFDLSRLGSSGAAFATH